MDTYKIGKLYRVKEQYIHVFVFSIEEPLVLTGQPFIFDLKKGDIFLVVSIKPIKSSRLTKQSGFNWSSKSEIQILFQNKVGWIFSDSILSTEIIN
jgi:hypothetical protein